MGASGYTLLGVAVGAVLTAFGSFLIGRQAFKREVSERRRSERLTLASDFLRRAEDLWNGQQDLGFAVVEIQSDRHNKEAHQRRLDAFAVSRPARIEARILVAQMRIVAPALVPAAVELMAASEACKAETHQSDSDHRNACLEKFEDSARQLIGPAD